MGVGNLGTAAIRRHYRMAAESFSREGKLPPSTPRCRVFHPPTGLPCARMSDQENLGQLPARCPKKVDGSGKLPARYARAIPAAEENLDGRGNSRPAPRMENWIPVVGFPTLQRVHQLRRPAAEENLDGSFETPVQCSENLGGRGNSRPVHPVVGFPTLQRVCRAAQKPRKT